MASGRVTLQAEQQASCRPNPLDEVGEGFRAFRQSAAVLFEERLLRFPSPERVPRAAPAAELGEMGVGDSHLGERLLEFRGRKTGLLTRGVLTNVEELFDVVSLKGLEDLSEIATLVAQGEHRNPSGCPRIGGDRTRGGLALGPRIRTPPGPVIDRVRPS